jgi:hypothetical protein
MVMQNRDGDHATALYTVGLLFVGMLTKPKYRVP